MKHIKLFENYNPTQKQQDAIEENAKTWYSEMTYDKNGKYAGGSVGKNHTIEKLVSSYIEHREKHNNSKSVSIIIENKRRILSEEEIEQLYQTNKYNL